MENQSMIKKMELPRLSTGELDLDRMPERLNDVMMQALKEEVSFPIPDLPTCDRKTFNQVLRMMLAALPRRQADDISGELFVAAYERQLGHINRSQAEYLLDKSLQTCKWFPTIAECLELLEGWRRNDEHVLRRAKIKGMMAREINTRNSINWPKVEVPKITQEAVDAMSPELIRMGLTCGALYKDEKTGKVRPVTDEPEIEPGSF